jgi:hypothetical protein
VYSLTEGEFFIGKKIILADPTQKVISLNDTRAARLLHRGQKPGMENKHVPTVRASVVHAKKLWMESCHSHYFLVASPAPSLVAHVAVSPSTGFIGAQIAAHFMDKLDYIYPVILYHNVFKIYHLHQSGSARQRSIGSVCKNEVRCAR